MVKPVCSLLFLLMGVTSAFGQQHLETQSYKMRENSLQNERSPRLGTIHTRITRGESVLSEEVVDVNEYMNVIVQFRSFPLAVFGKAGRSPSLAVYQSARQRIFSEHAEFRSDLAKLQADQRANSATVFEDASPEIAFEYAIALNGVALRARRWLVERIAGLPYVSSVSLDKSVRTCDETSNHVIGADSVRLQLGLMGDGILIGVIDTGIDYLHPDLGGGIGPSYKVVGGYDFVNSDTDPMDDHDHGTHVAGIIAADGASLTGVAPHAKLLALKALGQDGSGSSSWVIAAINYGVDPDGNPTTDDGVDVLNLSLTDPFGSPDDPMSQAINNATVAGVVCVVAAGNSGPSYMTVGSPASAKLAITVGATDNNDLLAGFSSRGPTRITYDLKPDIVAPGVGITSAKRGGGYVSFSGTSMATPHVAGAAALLLQQDSTLSPLDVKAKLLNTSMDLTLNPFAQGAGRLNVLKAARTKSELRPGSFAFGLIDQYVALFAKSETLTVKNKSTVPVTYTLSYTGLPAGAAISFSQNMIVVQPNDSGSVIVTLSVNNAITPDADSTTFSFTGHIPVTSVSDTVNLPISFVKYPYLIVKFNGFLPYGFVHNRAGQWWSRPFFLMGPDRTETFFLRRGTYDVIGQFATVGDPTPGEQFVIKENITVPYPTILIVDAAEAIFSYQITPVAANGSQVDLRKCNFLTFLTHKASGLSFGRGTFGFNSLPSFRYSPISNAYVYDWSLFTHRNFPECYSMHGSLEDFSSSHTFMNSSLDFKHLAFRYNPPFPVSNMYLLDITMGGGVSGFTNEDYLQPPFFQDWYLMPIPRSNFPYGSPLHDYTIVFEGSDRSPWDIFDSRLLFQLPTFVALNRDTVEVSPGYQRFFSSFSNQQITGSTVTAGLGPSHWGGTFSNSSSYVEFRTNTPVGYLIGQYENGVERIYAPLFPSQHQDVSPRELYFSLFRGAQLVKTGNVRDKYILLITNGYYDRRFRIPAPLPGQYTLEIVDTNYAVQGRKGRGIMRATFDRDASDNNPPSMSSLNILTGADFSDLLHAPYQAAVQFAVQDSNLQSISLAYKRDNEVTWNPLSLTIQNETYVATVPSGLASDFYDLRIVATDASGNMLEYTASPSFQVSSGPNRPYPAFPPFGATITFPPTLAWSSVQGANSYRIQLSTRDDFSTLAFDSSGITASSCVVAGLQVDSVCYWRVNASNANGVSTWSDIWYFRKRTVDPFAPSNKDTYVGSANPSTPHGNDQTLYLGGTAWQADTVNLFLQFDLTRIPPGTTVTSAKIDMYMFGQNGYMSYNYGVYEVLQDWDEQTLTWTNRPIHVSAPAAILNGDLWQGRSNQWNSIEGLGALVARWLADSSTNHGIVIKPISEFYGSASLRSFNYPDSNFHPRLVLNYVATAVEQTTIPTSYALYQNHPNPFNPSTIIRYDLPATTSVTLKVYNILGQETATLVNEIQLAGRYNISWTPENLSSGVYLYRIHAGTFVVSRKLLLLR